MGPATAIRWQASLGAVTIQVIDARHRDQPRLAGLLPETSIAARAA